MLNQLDSALGFHQEALRLRGKRQEIIAANIANADTPNYKARDIDFKTAMQSAMAGVPEGTFNTTKTSAGHLDGVASTTPSGRPGSLYFAPLFKVALTAIR